MQIARPASRAAYTGRGDDMPEGPLEFAAETPRPQDGARFDLYTRPDDLDRGTMMPNDLNGRYRVTGSAFVEIDGTRYLHVWYERATNE